MNITRPSLTASHKTFYDLHILSITKYRRKHLYDIYTVVGGGLTFTFVWTFLRN